MDCRRPFSIALALLAGSAGCSHHAASVPTAAAPATATPPAAVTAAAKPENLDPEAMKRQPKPETFVAFGDFSAREAEGAKTSSEQEQLRDRARKAYQEALKIDPTNVPAHKSLASLYASSNDCGRAKEICEAGLKLAPDDASLWFVLGMTYARTKDWQLAIEHITRATELDPENRSYRRHLGYTLARAGRYDESLVVFSRYEGEAKAHYYLAQMLDHLGQPDASKMHLQLALAKDPQLTDAAQMLVRITGAVPAVPAAAAAPIQNVSYTEAVSAAEAPAAPAPAPAPAAPAPRRFPPPPPPLRLSNY
jgi:tetratricopeptide (TPR) repeat protein